MNIAGEDGEVRSSGMDQISSQTARVNKDMRYYELIEEITAADRLRRAAEKRRAAHEKRNAAQRRKTNAAFKYQDAVRSANDRIQSANNTLATIKPS